MLLGICRPSKSISQQQFLQNFGSNKVNYGQLENGELRNFRLLYYPECDMVATTRLREIKNERKFQTFSSKSGSRSLTRGGSLQEVPNTVISLGNFWYFRKRVSEESWSLTRGDRGNRSFDCTSDKMKSAARLSR